MKIVIAPDKFKGTLTSFEFCNIVEKSILSIIPEANILKLPLADGGDGTIEIIHHYLNGEFINTQVKNPFFETINASYLFNSAKKIAFIEMAEASGIKSIKKHSLNVKKTSTYGTGELIKNAIEKGAKTIILGLGGSATNDCGIGMAHALGYNFLDKDQNPVFPIGENLQNIKYIDNKNVLPNLYEIDFKIACDVTNPLYGAEGAVNVYAKQKGASDEDLPLLENGVISFSEVINDYFNIKSQQIIGGGAAGGMGVGCTTFLQGKLISGNELIQNLANFKEKIKDADWIITGEGKLDNQTASGKTIQGILKARNSTNKIAVLCGKITLSKNEINNLNINHAEDIISIAKNEKDAFENTTTHLSYLAKKVAKKIKKT